MHDPKIHRRTKLIPPPATRFTLMVDGLYLEFEHGKEDTMIAWLRANIRAIEEQCERERKAEREALAAKEVTIGGIKINLPGKNDEENQA